MIYRWFTLKLEARWKPFPGRVPSGYDIHSSPWKIAMLFLWGNSQDPLWKQRKEPGSVNASLDASDHCWLFYPHFCFVQSHSWWREAPNFVWSVGFIGQQADFATLDYWCWRRQQNQFHIGFTISYPTFAGDTPVDTQKKSSENPWFVNHVQGPRRSSCSFMFHIFSYVTVKSSFSSMKVHEITLKSLLDHH